MTDAYYCTIPDTHRQYGVYSLVPAVTMDANGQSLFDQCYVTRGPGVHRSCIPGIPHTQRQRSDKKLQTKFDYRILPTNDTLSKGIKRHFHQMESDVAGRQDEEQGQGRQGENGHELKVQGRVHVILLSLYWMTSLLLMLFSIEYLFDFSHFDKASDADWMKNKPEAKSEYSNYLLALMPLSGILLMLACVGIIVMLVYKYSSAQKPKQGHRMLIKYLVLIVVSSLLFGVAVWLAVGHQFLYGECISRAQVRVLTILNITLGGAVVAAGLGHLWCTVGSVWCGHRCCACCYLRPQEGALSQHKRILHPLVTKSPENCNNLVAHDLSSTNNYVYKSLKPAEVWSLGYADI